MDGICCSAGRKHNALRVLAQLRELGLQIGTVTGQIASFPAEVHNPAFDSCVSRTSLVQRQPGQRNSPIRISHSGSLL